MMYLVIRQDRHVDDEFSAHLTLEGANRAVEEFCRRYEGETWQERGFVSDDLVRYLSSSCEEGPTVRIERLQIGP